ncbi:MAG: ABC transporter permease [Clostridia bacterium]|nr:ABC transporter permease [Clostridia bacterium]
MNIIAFLSSAIRFSAVFLFGSTGETITEKSGHLNLGTPGIMCMGAIGGCVGANIYVSNANTIHAVPAILLPLLFALLFAGLTGLLYCFLTVSLRSNQNVTGLMITTFGVGLAKFIKADLGESVDAAIGAVCTHFRNLFPFADNLGWFGEIFFSYGILVYLAIAVAVATAIILKKTRVGLHLRAVGENPATADAAGINVTAYRYTATVVGSAVSGLGGLFFIFDYMGAWDSGLTSTEALGWLAVALVIFTVWKPDLGILGSILFSALYLLPNFVEVSFAMRDLFNMLPYIVTIVVLVLTSMRKKRESQPPANLGLNYFREER